MAKYGEKAGEKVEKAMHEMKEGKLKTGSGKKVTDRDQAIAIGLSQARKEGGKVPKKKKKLKGLQTRFTSNRFFLRIHTLGRFFIEELCECKENIHVTEEKTETLRYANVLGFLV
ncbi:MAG: hypothetical protein A3D31_01770 [Candidatus Fluviicola riflensis]|nr:MAG: hypothetical protein CHH17_13265 [Candidatus Fluviicola riflensis]OGS78727.1 MAG: hypothetical protein A3D31_01770 [Candidatus Fluviicola riflensis]OGS86158.1 MAG: hypothetical protein A2724_01225 [Fluviicola sp. RIFCSPHIGHO2_01_FULL_43_53]OGS87689.1 MAG: hypothetical protein A3E30_16435 [Fluviicola sp. RIFCSPHIGHO2_12_FULL_43_24]